jgi:hypothetical protein
VREHSGFLNPFVYDKYIKWNELDLRAIPPMACTILFWMKYIAYTIV